jgi:hypothetical protein
MGVYQAFGTTVVPDISGSWANAANAVVLDGSVATGVCSVDLGGGGAHHWGIPSLVIGGFHFKIPTWASIVGAVLVARVRTAGDAILPLGDLVILDSMGGDTLTPAIASSASIGSALAWVRHGGSLSGMKLNAGLVASWIDLAGAGFTPAWFNDPTNFSFRFSANGATNLASVDLDSVGFFIFTADGDTEDSMDNYLAGSESGWRVIGGEGVTINSSATNMFPGAPGGTRMALFTVRGAGLTCTGDGATPPTAGAAGSDYFPSVSPYRLPMNKVELAKFQAIQNGGATTIYAEYWGIP